MFHKNVLSSAGSGSTASPFLLKHLPQQNPSQSLRPILVSPISSGDDGTPLQPASSRLVDLVAISAHRCASFFAEAAVLVLVLALLDRFMAKGSMSSGWILSTITLSLTLLAASVATDFTARRWLKAH
jgi:hypothetical protein